MVEFIGRKNELKVLENAYLSKKSAFIPIYGRRRVGKSELILQFLKDKSGVYFVGKRAKSALQIKEFLTEASVSLQEPLLSGYYADSWRNAISAVANISKNYNKLVIVFDEFQWVVEAAPELPGVLQELWDRAWKNSSIMLILCGSYIGFMEREVLGKKSPLFGRRTAQIFLQPFCYLEAAEFHSSFSFTDRARTYFVCGGIPLYLQFFSSRRSVELNIMENLLNPYAPLYHEPDFLLREELRDVGNYYAILMAIASGFNSHANISKQTNIDNRALHYYLKQLMELGYLRRRYPVTDKKPIQRHVHYILDDPLLQFWFRFIYPNMSYIQQVGSEKALQERIIPHLASYFGHCFEQLCRETLPALYLREGLNASFTIGEYWNKDVQIDIVGLRDDNWTDLGECKWGTMRSTKAIENELEKKVKYYPNTRNATICKRIFTRNPVIKKHLQSSDFRYHSLKDIYTD